MKAEQKIDLYLKENGRLVENYLKEVFFNNQQKTKLVEAMAYSLFAGGKRIRPVLMIATAEVLGLTPAVVLPAAAALEMIHTYSLIHDDLPAMDNDDLRRGKPTSHKVFGEALAILAGDTLQTYAYEILINGLLKTQLASAKILKIVEMLSVAAGACGMAGGQALDIVGNKDKTSLVELQNIHKLKTGALLTFCTAVPVIIAEPADKIKSALAGYIEALGQAFQIKDDILDVNSSAQQLGKTPGKDNSSGKATYVNLLGLARAEEYLLKETEKAYNFASLLGRDNILQLMVKYLLERAS